MNNRCVASRSQIYHGKIVDARVVKANLFRRATVLSRNRTSNDQLKTENMLRSMLLGAFNHRTLALLRWDLYFARIRLSNYLRRSHRSLRRHLLSMPRPRYLNLGSGPRGIQSPHWLNIDGVWDVGVQFLIDFTRPIPLPDASIDGVFCEHVLEHFTHEEGQQLLSECARILVPGGVARFITPDAAKIMRTYFSDPDSLVERRRPNSDSAMEAVNSWFRQRYEHQFLYDWPLARHTFLAAGFSRVELSAFRTSQSAPREILIDDDKYEWESLYIDAVMSMT